MKTKPVIVLAALAGALAAQAQVLPQIDRVGGRSIEILTAAAEDSAQGLRVWGLVRRGTALSRPPETAHLDVTAFDAEGRLLVTTPTRIGLLTATRRHRDPGRYVAVLPLLTLRDVVRLEVRYQALPHAAEKREVAR